MTDPLVMARSGSDDLVMLPAMANRHGCITGATGTGKTISLQLLAEQFSRPGVPVFLADVKGDLTRSPRPEGGEGHRRDDGRIRTWTSSE